MKNYKYLGTLLVLILGSILTLNSCDSIISDDETDFGKGPILAQFVNTSGELNIIQDPAIPSIDVEVPITVFGGRNVALDKDITLTVAASADSEAIEGVEFELLSNSIIIPAGELTANVTIRVLTLGLTPFDFKNAIIEITDSSESISETKTYSLALKALPETTLAGTYEAVDGQYWNSGTYRGDFNGRTYSIEAISPGLYRHVGLAYWIDGNNFYFTVDDETGLITVLDKNLDGSPTLLNGSPIMTCDGNNPFEMVPCDDTTSVSILKPDGHHVVKLTTGYFRGSGSTREFFMELVRQ